MNIRDIAPMIQPYSTTDVSLASLHLRFEGGLKVPNMNPYFQRPLVWREPQKIAYVEHLLWGGASGRFFYFNDTGMAKQTMRGELVIIDGKQRMDALRLFLDNKLPVFGGHFLQDIDGIDSALHCNDISWCVGGLTEQKDILRWYLELNAGQMAHTDEELNRVRELMEECD